MAQLLCACLLFADATSSNTIAYAGDTGCRDLDAIAIDRIEA